MGNLQKCYGLIQDVCLGFEDACGAFKSASKTIFATGSTPHSVQKLERKVGSAIAREKLNKFQGV